MRLIKRSDQKDKPKKQPEKPKEATNFKWVTREGETVIELEKMNADIAKDRPIGTVTLTIHMNKQPNRKIIPHLSNHFLMNQLYDIANGYLVHCYFSTKEGNFNVRHNTVTKKVSNEISEFVPLFDWTDKAGWIIQISNGNIVRLRKIPKKKL